MSATRDQSQKTTFVYSNLYTLYRKGKLAAQNSPNILKTEDLRPGVKVEPYTPVELLSKRVDSTPETQAASVGMVQARDQAISSLKSNLGELQELQKRLRFMLKDIETLSGKTKKE